MKYKTAPIIYKRLCAVFAAGLFIIVLLSGCSLIPSSGNDIEGIWYEQEPDGGTLTIKGNTMTYANSNYSRETTFSSGRTTDEGIEIVTPGEYWYYIDMLYDPSNETITGHDLPHTDGDGGYHLHTFKKTEYVAPPEPVYGERIDISNPDAPKEFSKSTISFLLFTVTEPVRANGDMAPEEPVCGNYWYSLVVNDDGTGELESDFCQAITVTAEQIQELSDIFFDSGLPSLNGLNVFTEEMPEDTQSYDLYLEFKSGESYYSSANGKDVSDIWYTEGYLFHQCLFNMLREAGYNSSTGEFHSTEPMKRIGYPDDTVPAYTITSSLIREERKGEAYDYNVHCEYPVFSAEGDAPAALLDTLSQLSEEYKEQALADLEENYNDMAAVPRSVWQKEDKKYAYSFYSPTFETVMKGMFTFWISEGHASSLGIGKYEYGYYPNWRFCIDEKTGKIMCVYDLFNDKEAALDAVTDALCQSYFHSDDYVSYFSSDEYRQMLDEALSLPESDGGIGFSPGYDCLELYFPEELSKDKDYSIDLKIYYDSIQDILNDTYCSEW